MTVLAFSRPLGEEPPDSLEDLFAGTEFRLRACTVAEAARFERFVYEHAVSVDSGARESSDVASARGGQAPRN